MMPKMSRDFRIWWVYLLRCKNGTVYVGVSPDPVRRFTDHQKGRSTFTRRHRPLELIGAAPVGLHKQALREERLIKRMGHAEKLALAAILRDLPGWRDLHEAHPCLAMSQVQGSGRG